MSPERAESLLSGNVTYHQQVSYCGKPRCRKCREGVGHGPYWYAYRNENGRTTRTYIGKELPPELQKLQDAASGLPAGAEHTASETDPTVIRIRVLGQFQLERRHGRQWQGVTEAAWQHQRVRSLLAYLLSSPGRKWGREQVMDALWPELDFENASGRLDRAVYSLRQLFEPSLERPGASKLLRSEREGLVLADQSQIWVDADAFEFCIARANASSDPGEKEQLLEEAVALYGGDFLPEEQHADWAVARREMLQRAWLGLLLELADLRIARGALFNAVEPLDRLLMSDPANEAAVQRLMVSLTQLDRRGEALQAFSRFSSALKRLYGIAPLPETRQLYKAIQQGNIPVLLPHTTQGISSDSRSAGGEGAQQPRPVNRTPFGRTHSNPLIGREGEVEELRQMLLHTEESTHTAASSRKKFSILPSEQRRRPHCAVLVGEAGIGKTRLAEEISREAQQRGWTIAWSRVYAQESSVPFRQWTEVLRNAMTYGLLPKQEISRQPLVFQPLSALLPELHTVLPQVTFPAPLSPEQEQLRLWEATLALLVTISERTPLLLVLDDFHWADVSSCELFAYLVRRLQDHPIAIIGTYRDNELPATHPLRSLLTALQREQVMAHMPVEPLTKEQIARLVHYLPPPVVQHIQNQAAGNPFFAEELARGLSSVTDSGASPLGAATMADVPVDAQVHAGNGSSTVDMSGTLPDTIAAVLELRMGRLSTPCQRLLGNAAVLGGSFEFTTIARMEAGGINATDEDTILDLIEEALQAGVIAEEGTGTHISYHFWHPLLASHLYDKLSAARRASLHRRASSVLQHLYRNREDEGAATITHHLVEGGGDAELIVHYAELAGNHAYALSAYPEAERYYRIAATHLETLQNEQGMREGEGEQAQLAYLLERLGECTKLQGNFEDARQFYEKTLEIRSQQEKHAAQIDAKHEAQIRTLLWCEIGWTWYGVGNLSQARQCCTRGETILHEAMIETGTAWASIRFQQSYICWQEGKEEEAQQLAQEALTLFKDVLGKQDYLHVTSSQLTVTERTLAGHPVNLGRTYTILGTLANYSGQPSIALTHFNAALTLFEQYDSQREIAIVCCDIGDIHLRKTEHEQAQSFFRRALYLAEQVGDIPLISVIYGNLGEVAIRFGALLDAEKYLKQGVALAEQIREYIYMNVLYVDLAIVAQDQNKLADATKYIGKALSAGRRINNTSCIALALVALGNFRITQVTGQVKEEAQSRRLLWRAKKTLEHALHIEGLDVETKLKGELALAQVLFLTGALEQALQLATQTFDDATHYELSWGQVYTQRLLGRILAALGQQDRADEYFAQAMQAFNKYGMRLEYARTLYTYGLVLVNRQENAEQHRAQGMRYLEEAQRICKDCHATFDVQLVEHMLRSIEHNNA